MDDVEFMKRTDALVDQMRDRLQYKDIFFTPGPTPAGEHAVVLDLLLGIIGRGKVPISQRERDELCAVMGHLDLPVKFLGSINDWENIVAAALIIDDERIADAPARPVTAHENPDFGDALRHEVALHIDLPPSLHGPFVDHFTTTAGVGIQVDLARTIPDEYMRNGRTCKPTTMESKIVSMLILMVSACSIRGGGILLRNFEHWWTTAHPEAKTLIRQMPTILAAERYGDATLHVALADISPATTAEVITALANAEVEESLNPAPIPTFKYPTTRSGVLNRPEKK
ncbi:hypothetical protein MOQ72_25120 [Saccharopolyspora sp. K220]|uniref:hypothetical protein n=1 Tax=Saccharopolyspora soli TaxID=2926618 RepID=UPI001F573C47|nr:hypothetical protein [Saccharopolyspora soli]MCI2420734.1 hypothetical protein [Saccharopolyspora soli]